MVGDLAIMFSTAPSEIFRFPLTYIIGESCTTVFADIKIQALSLYFLSLGEHQRTKHISLNTSGILERNLLLFLLDT